MGSWFPHNFWPHPGSGFSGFSWRGTLFSFSCLARRNVVTSFSPLRSPSLDEDD